VKDLGEDAKVDNLGRKTAESVTKEVDPGERRQSPLGGARIKKIFAGSVGKVGSKSRELWSVQPIEKKKAHSVGRLNSGNYEKGTFLWSAGALFIWK